MVSRTGFWNVAAALFLSFFRESKAQAYVIGNTLLSIRGNALSMATSLGESSYLPGRWPFTG